MEFEWYFNVISGLSSMFCVKLPSAYLQPGKSDISVPGAVYLRAIKLDIKEYIFCLALSSSVDHDSETFFLIVPSCSV